ncbi:cell adhesion molecule DSCAM-like [Panonychus citri]|uniref:cell adhesion molecule DSCAM-like n=1 Tax=Panonychus citri TaxID=50023 RepID=UPI002306F7FF|nr:cell adhesion molecule DSCAM-like [Panonychus citri]
MKIVQLVILFIISDRIIGQEIPKVNPFSPFIKPVIGGKTSFTCQSLFGSAPLSITWVKDGQEISDSSEIRIRNIEDSSMLIIDSIKSSHSGNYSCRISNRYGSDSYSSELLVEGPPSWIEKPHDVKIHIGETIEIKCSTAGYPKPRINWKKLKGSSWTSLDSSDLFKRIDDNQLSIVNASPKHSGKYGCLVSNSIEPNLWSEFNIAIDVFPAKFKEKKSYVSAKRDTSLELECSAEGDKPITIRWSKDSVILNKVDYQRHTILDTPTTEGLKSTLTIRSADLVDDGSYLCLAENEFGKDERNIRVTIIEAPPAPQNLMIRQAWSRSVSLNWAAPSSNASPILGYIVRYWKITGPGGNERLREINVTSSMNNVLINGLEPGSFYEAEIIALNEVGIGQPSRTIKFETGEEEPTGAPVDLQAIARGPTTIRVSWKPPSRDKWNGKILGYYVGYRRAGDFKTPHSLKTIDAASHNHTYEYLLTSLVKGTTYAITVKAYNSAGSGPEYQEILAETLLGNVPPSPRFKVLSTTPDSLSLKYNVAPGTASVQLIQLHFKEFDEPDWKELALTYDGKEVNEYTLTSLNPSTIYKLYITASNEHGISDPSQIITSKTGRSLNDLTFSGSSYDSTSLLGGAGPVHGSMSSSFGAMVYFPAITISVASIIIVIVIAFVFVKKARLEAVAKTNFEFCQASQAGTLAYNRSTGTTFGTVQRFVDHDKTMSLVAAGPFEDSFNGQLPTAYSKIPVGTEKRNSTLGDARHFYDYPQ